MTKTKALLEEKARNTHMLPCDRLMRKDQRMHHDHDALQPWALDDLSTIYEDLRKISYSRAALYDNKVSRYERNKRASDPSA